MLWDIDCFLIFWFFFLQENGGCGFFEWCDGATGAGVNGGGTQNYASNTSYSDVPCPCGAGLCLILTAKTGNNIGRQFFRCPAHQVIFSGDKVFI